MKQNIRFEPWGYGVSLRSSKVYYTYSRLSLGFREHNGEFINAHRFKVGDRAPIMSLKSRDWYDKTFQ